VQCSDPTVTWSAAVDTALSSRIRRLGARAAALRNSPPLDVVANPGFERPAASDGSIPDWAVTTRRGVSIQLDKTQKHGGQQSVRIASDGAVACLVSRPLAAPITGRLAISVWLRVADAARQPPLRLALDGKLDGRDYYRFGQVGLAPGPGQPVKPIPTTWEQYLFSVDDLPLAGLTQLRARFDLMGAGEVWVDDVQVFNLAFNRSEMVELSKIITLADVKLQQRQIGDCLHLLEGYWPRFLEENVPLPVGNGPSDTDIAKRHSAEERQSDRSSLLNRMKDLLPDSLRR
jgi:hypothetical protein